MRADGVHGMRMMAVHDVGAGIDQRGTQRHLVLGSTSPEPKPQWIDDEQIAVVAQAANGIVAKARSSACAWVRMRTTDGSPGSSSWWAASI